MAYTGKKLSSLHGDALKARLAHLSATHNTSAIPLKYLTTSQARERVMNARLDSPVVPGDSMTNRDLAREANAATSVQYGPLMASQALQPKQTNDYYNQYLSTLKAAQDSQAAQGQALAQTLGNIGAAGQQQATAENTRVNDQAAADAKVRGAVQDPSLAANAANAAQVTRNIATGGAQTAGLLGQNAAAYMTALEASGGAARVGALNRNTSDALQTKREAGAFKQQYVGKRRSEEVTNTATAALAGQKQDTADASFSAQTGYTPAQWAQMTPAERLTALKKATRAKTKPAAPPKPRSQEEVDRPYLTKYGLTYKQFKAKVAAGQKPKPLSSRAGNSPKSGTGKDEFGNTALQRRSAASAYKKALRIGKVIGGKDPAQILLALTQKFPSVDDTILAGAAQEAALGHIGPKTAAHLKRRGIRGRPLAPSSQQTTGGGASTYDKGARPG